jgi:hypothetical protein
MTAELVSFALPILVSAVLVFIVSSILHLAVPWHRNDYPKIPNEERALEALRLLAIPPGDYMVPNPDDPQVSRLAACADTLDEGPVMVLTVLPNGRTPMARNLTLWFVYLVVVAALSALADLIALRPAAGQPEVMHLTLLTSFMGYTLALWQMTIWYRRAWTTTAKATIDGLIYAAVTAGTFAWIWPR